MFRSAQLCGKVTGLDYDIACMNFESAEKIVKNLQINHIFNPVKEVPSSALQSEAMRMCVAHLLDVADCVFMLKSWEDSEGARLEHELAKQLGKQIFYL